MAPDTGPIFSSPVPSNTPAEEKGGDGSGLSDALARKTGRAAAEALLSLSVPSSEIGTSDLSQRSSSSAAAAVLVGSMAQEPQVSPILSSAAQRPADSGPYPEKNGELWVCTGRKAHPDGEKYGYTYQFKYKFPGDEEGANQANKKAFPAIESTDESLYALLVDRTSEEEPGQTQFLNQLGFTLEGVRGDPVLSIPDHTYLDIAWKALQEEDPDLPDLKIGVANGALSSDDFLEILGSNDVVYSQTGEMVHDALIHVIRTALRAREGKAPFEEVQTRLKEFVKIAKKINKKLEQSPENIELKILFFALSALVDGALSRSDNERAEGALMLHSLSWAPILGQSGWYAKIREEVGQSLTNEQISSIVIKQFEQFGGV